MYKSLTACFMTGTGNSFRVASWAAQVAEQRGIGAELIQVKAGEEARPLPSDGLSVFSYPTHGFTAPCLIMRYIWRLPKGNKAHAVVLPTRAGIRVGGVFIPGLEGTAGYLIALLLWLRGYSVRGVMGVDMPSNWTAVHWGLNEKNVAVITSMAESKVKGAIGAFLDSHKHFDGIVQLLIGLLLAKISLMYLILAQVFLAKLFFASDRCNGCALCQTICPKKALKMAGTPQRPYWTYACDSCMACMNYCPRSAIEVSPFVITLFYYITSVPVFAYVARYIGDSFGLQLETVPLFGLAIRYIYIIVAVGTAYGLLHFAFGSRLVRKIMGLLSHTRYFRRYRAVTLKDIHQR